MGSHRGAAGSTPTSVARTSSVVTGLAHHAAFPSGTPRSGCRTHMFRYKPTCPVAGLRAIRYRPSGPCSSASTSIWSPTCVRASGRRRGGADHTNRAERCPDGSTGRADLRATQHHLTIQARHGLDDGPTPNGGGIVRDVGAVLCVLSRLVQPALPCIQLLEPKRSRNALALQYNRLSGSTAMGTSGSRASAGGAPRNSRGGTPDQQQRAQQQRAQRQ